MEVNYPYYVASTWLGNVNSYNWDIRIICSWNSWDDAGRGSWTSRLGSEMVLKHWHWALHFGIAMMLRHGPRALHLGTAVMFEMRSWTPRLDTTSVALIVLASEVWTLLSDDLSSVIFRQSKELPLKFLKLCGWLGRVLKHFRLFFWQQALKTGLTIFWDTLSLTLSEFWSSWVYC